MVGQGFNVVRLDEPLLVLGVQRRHRPLNHLKVIVRWQVQGVARSDIIIDQLIAVLN